MAIMGKIKNSQSNEVIDFMFVLPGVTFHPSGGYKVVYAISSKLSEIGYNVGILFIRDIYDILYRKTKNPLLKMYSTQDRPHLRIFSKIANYSLSYKFLPMFRRIFKVNFVEQINNVKIYFSKGFIPNLIIKRLVANGWETAYLVNDFPNFIEKYNFIQQEDDDWACNGALSTFAGETYKFALKKIVINEEMRKRFSLEPAYRIRIGIEKSKFPLKISIEERVNNSVLIPLRKGQYKGAQNAIETMKLLKQIIKDIRITCFGNYKGNDIPSFVDHKGVVSDEDLVLLYNNASIFFLPSVIEGTPLTPLEAMNCGTAVVSTDNKGIREYLNDKENGLIIPINNPTQAVEAIVSLIENPTKRITIAKAGFKTASLLNYDLMTSDFIEAIKSYEMTTLSRFS